MDDPGPIEPDYSAAQREEVGRIDYLLDELRKLRDRGVVPPGAVEAVEAEKLPRRGEIERRGLASGALKAARRLADVDARSALALAERARGLDPGGFAAWELSADLLGRLREFDRAVATCREAAEAHGHSALAVRVAGFESAKARHGHAATIEAATARARSAASGGDFEAALAACRDILAVAPRQHWALATAISSLVELGRLDEAEGVRDRLQLLSPREAADWSIRIKLLRGRGEAPSPRAEVEAGPEVLLIGDIAPAPAPKPPAPAAAGPGFSAVARGFLEDHWQKLILSLAVLLIVVSSTVGAAMVLGDRLWMAEGKCLLATAYTLMFAGFGRGLSRWGADRAGRIMRLTTLIVLPLDFALVGELPGLGRGSPLGMAVLAVDSAAMIGLAWLVCRSLGISGGRGTVAALVALGMVNALTPRSAPFAWGFAAILGASVAFAASGEWLGHCLARRREPDEPDGDDAPYFAFGLLAFSYLVAVGRLGGLVLGVPPTLYALPAMLAAFAAVRVADGLRASGEAGHPSSLLRLGGYGLSALAFALGLARPEARLPIYSGNTLAAALVGLALYGRALRSGRQPAFLYAGFAALFLAYFGVHDLVKETLAGFEGRVGGSLGYGRKLPLPFKALNGLVFNSLLAGLSLFFARRWRDDRLAWHCHLIGIPLSVAACVLSGFDPVAAALTMGGYAVAYGVATWLFAAPGLAYLACAAFAGAAVANLGRFGDLAPGARSLGLAAVGLALWAACRALAIERVPPSYRVPVARSARAVAVVALVLAAHAAWPSGPPTWTAAAACGALAVLYVLIGLESPLPTVALAAGACAAAGALIAVDRTAGRAWLGAWAAGLGVAYQVAGPWAREVAGRRGDRPGGPSRLEVYPAPLFLVGLALAGLASWLAGSGLVDRLPGASARDLASVGATMALVALGLGIASRWGYRFEWLARGTVLAGSIAAVAGAMAAGAARGWPASASMAPTLGGLALGLVGLGDRIRGRESGWLALYRRPLLDSMAVAVMLAWAACVPAWPDSRTLAASLTLTAVALALAARQVPSRAVAHLALASGLAAWMVGTAGAGLARFEGLPGVGILVQVYLVGAVAAAWALRRWGRESGEARRAFAAALPEFATAVVPVALMMGAVGPAVADWAGLTGALALGSAVFLGLAAIRGRADHVLLGLVLAWLATGGGTRWLAGDRPSGVLLGWLALASAVDGLVAVGVGWIGRRRGFGAIVLGPLADLGVLLAAASFALGVAGPALTLDAYPMAVAALLLTIPALLASAAMGRTAWRTRGAIVVGVAAAYLTLFELGRGQSGHVSALGVLASGLAVVTWGLHRVTSRPSWEGWRRVFADPPRDATIVLATLAVIPGWGEPGPLLLASLPFLLLVGALPRAGWLYPSLGLMLASGAFAADDRWGPGALTPGAVASGFACWALGAGLARWKPGLCRRLGLPEGLGLESPPFHAAIALGAVALGLRLDAALVRGEPWSSSPWVPALVGVLSLLMLRPYPARGWADGFVFLLSTAGALAVGPLSDSATSWGLAALTLALLWRGAARIGVRARPEGGFGLLPEVFGEWSLVLLASGGLPVAIRVAVAAVAGASGGPGMAPREWWEGLVAVLLIGANLELAGLALPAPARRVGLHAAATLGLWWLAAPGSPIAGRLGLDPAAWLPLLTAAQALAASRSTGRPVALYGSGLALAAVALTGGRAAGATSATLLLATAAQASVAVSTRRPGFAGLASACWGLALLCLADRVAQGLGWVGPADRATAVAVGQAVAALGLVAAGGWDRRRGLGLSRVVEGAAAAALGVAAIAVGVATLAGGGPGALGRSLVGVGVMAAVGSTCVALASRWGSMAMAFAAQGSILLGFAALRSGFALSPAGDAAALLILAGVDLGVAEVAGRGRRAFALPAMATSLALPLVAVGLAFRAGPVGDVPLFALFASGTFYAATCGRLRWKGLGYAAAVLYNAALWMLWARFGWEMAEAPQFYAVPVGFSTILLAQANARELGRSRVDAIRGAGLALIYLALAVPIWRTASLAAWATVLGVSLLGVFVGIGLRSRAFLWLGLAGFVLDVVFQLGRVGMEHALAKWAIMLGLGVLLVLFVALNEKRQLMGTIRKYVDVVRGWE